MSSEGRNDMHKLLHCLHLLEKREKKPPKTYEAQMCYFSFFENKWSFQLD